MTQPLVAIPALLDSMLDDLEQSFADLHEAAIEKSQGGEYTSAFRLLLRIEDISPRFHRLVNELRGARTKRAAA